MLKRRTPDVEEIPDELRDYDPDQDVPVECRPGLRTRCGLPNCPHHSHYERTEPDPEKESPKKI